MGEFLQVNKLSNLTLIVIHSTNVVLFYLCYPVTYHWKVETLTSRMLSDLYPIYACNIGNLYLIAKGSFPFHKFYIGN